MAPELREITDKVLKLCDKYDMPHCQVWLSLVLFVRDLVGHMNLFPEETKLSIQKEFFDLIRERDYSLNGLQKTLSVLESRIESTVSGHVDDLKLQLNKEKRFSKELLQELDEIVKDLRNAMGKREQDLNTLGDRTIEAIEQNEDKLAMITTIRRLVNQMIEETRKEARDWELRARALERQVSFDPLLTELYNRRSFDSYLREAVAQHTFQKSRLSLVLIDVDHFKAINDRYGHQVGDDVLKVLAKVVQSHSLLHPSFAARYGGEELVVVYEGKGVGQTSLLAEAIRLDVEQYEFQPRDKGSIVGEPIHFTISAGVSDLQSGWNEADLLKAADAALYLAKEKGRNSVMVYTPDLQTPFSGPPPGGSER